MSQRDAGRLRIVGGEWRRRLIAFDTSAAVRPTPDRVRQTVFDWLAPRIEGAACVDLYAGSGALGLEALSRGAATVEFVERGTRQIADISAAVMALGGMERARMTQAEVLSWIGRPPLRPTFDIAFVDPPYAAGLLLPSLSGLRPWLKSDNRVYVEWPADQTLALPEGYQWLREKKAGQVSFGLISYTQGERV